MTNQPCLNCGKELTDKFCSGCGQKAATHRISFKHFLLHDVMHGTFHLDSGMLFTAKEALLRPGKAALAYIEGKRKPYYNIFYFILILAGFMFFMQHFYKELQTEESTIKTELTYELENTANDIKTFFDKNKRYILFLFIPISALLTFLFFRKQKLNPSEHAIIGGMLLLGLLLINTIHILILYIHLWVPFSTLFAEFVEQIFSLYTFLFVGYGLYNAFGKDYSMVGFLLRLFGYAFFFVVIMILMLLVFIYFIAQGEAVSIQF
jgi:hypothetical protein